MFSSATGVNPRARMWPASGKAISPSGSTTTVRSSFGSCSTETLKVSPVFRVCAFAPGIQRHRQNKTIRIRMVIPLIRSKVRASPQVGFSGRRLFKTSIADNPVHLTDSQGNIIDYKYLRNRCDRLDRKNAVLLLVCNNIANYLI